MLVFPCMNVSMDANLLIPKLTLVYQLPLEGFSCEAKIREPSLSKSYLCLLSNGCNVRGIFFLPHQEGNPKDRISSEKANREQRFWQIQQIQGPSAILTIASSVDSAKWISPPKSQCWIVAVQTTCLLILFLLHICNCLVPSGRSM